MRKMKEFGSLHLPAIIILVKPKISGITADDVCKRLARIIGFDQMPMVLVGEYGAYGIRKKWRWS